MFLFEKTKNNNVPIKPDVKISTAFTYAVIIFKKIGYNQKQAEDLAFKTVEGWIIDNKLDKKISSLWKFKTKIA